MTPEQRAAKANEDAMARFDEAAEEKDEKRSEELLSEGTKHAEEAKRWAEVVKQREQLRASRESDAARRMSGTPERAFAGEKAEDDRGTSAEFELPSEAQLESRSMALARILREGVEKVGEQVAVVAKREWPVEMLFLDAVRSRVAVMKGGSPTLVGERKAAYDEYQRRARAVQVRIATPITGGQLAGTAGSGGEMVPETWVNEIISNMAYYGPMNFGRVRMFANDNIGEIHIPTVTDNETKRARIVAEATSAPKTRVTTSERTLNPRNTAVQIPFSDQMLLGGNINLRAFIERDVPEWFGRSFNSWFTVGTGSGQPQGVLATGGSGVTYTGREHSVATKAVFLEADIMGLIGTVDKSYLMLPGTSLQAHWNLILKLMQLRSGTGERVFPLSADRMTIIVPGGGPTGFEANNAILDGSAGSGPGNAVNAKIGFVGDIGGCYGTAMVGGMRVEAQRNLESFQTLLSWNTFADGKVLNEQAFGILTQK